MELNFKEMIQPVPYKNKIVDNGYVIWCGSYIKANDGKYHAYYSRWKKKYGHVTGWVSHSEVAHAVSDNIDGPYIFSDLSLPPRSREYWDGLMTHNPYMMVSEDKYYLYYIGTTAPEGTSETPNGYTPDWWAYRNGQRIGVAVSDSPYGPWTRFDEPILSPSTDLDEDGDTKWDSMAVTNPAIAFGGDGKVVMLYKAIKDTTGGDMTDRNGPVKFGVATSDSPVGPFTKSPKLIFTNLNDSEDKRMISEDPFVWYSKKHGNYMSVARDVVGMFGGEDCGLALFESIDGVNDWKPCKNPFVLANRFVWEDGKISIDKVERPWVMFDEDENPIMLFGATGLDEKRADTTNIFIPMKNKGE